VVGTLVQTFDEASGESKLDFRYRSTLQSRLVDTLTHLLLLCDASHDVGPLQRLLHGHAEALLDFAVQVRVDSEDEDLFAWGHATTGPSL
jgi:hypothetical protein